MVWYGLTMGLVVQPLVMAFELGHPGAAFFLALVAIGPWVVVTTIREPWSPVGTVLLTAIVAAESIALLQGDGADRAIGWVAATIVVYQFAGVMWLLHLFVPWRGRRGSPPAGMPAAPVRTPVAPVRARRQGRYRARHTHAARADDPTR